MLTLKLAFRNLFRNTRRTVLTVLLIGFSLGAMIVTDGVIIGMTKVMTDTITHTLNGEAVVQHRGFSQAFDVGLYVEHSAAVETVIESDPHVAAYAPRVLAGGMVSSSYNVASGFIHGVDAGKELTVSRISEAIVDGKYLTGEAGEILLGTPLAELLEVSLGDRIVLTVSEADTGELSQALFRVSGLFKFGLREIDDNFVFINLARGREVLGIEDGSHQIVIRFVDPDDATRPDLPVYQQLNTDDLEAISWLDANPEISSILELTGFSSVIVGFILFVLVSLGVINSMFMSIYERIYEIGVVKAIGTRPTDLLLLVIFEAGLIAAISCVFGIAVGGGLDYLLSVYGVPLGEIEFEGINFDNAIFPVPQIHQFVNFPVYVVMLTMLASLYPARFASRINPATALQRSL